MVLFRNTTLLDDQSFPFRILALHWLNVDQRLYCHILSWYSHLEYTFGLNTTMKFHLHFFLFLSFFFFVCLFVFRATPVAYGSSQARGGIFVGSKRRIRAVAVGLHHRYATCTTAHSNAWSFTHWARPGIKPASSLTIVGFITTAPPWELLGLVLNLFLDPTWYGFVTEM